MKLNTFSGSPLSDSTLRALVLANMYSTAPILNYLEFYSMTGNADSMRKGVNATGAGQNRDIDSGYTPRVTTPEFEPIVLKIMGDEIKTDIAHERRSGDVGSERRRQLESFGRNLGLYFQDEFINGTGTGKRITGIDKLIPENRVTTLGENGMIVPIGTTDAAKKLQNSFLKSLTKMVRSVKGGASCLLMNFDVIALLFAIGREYVSKVNVPDALGNMYELASFGGVPIVDSGYKNDGSGLVIPNTKTVGTSVDCTTIYAVKFGDRENLTAATNTGVDVIDEGKLSTHYSTMVDFDCNLGLLDPLAVAQMDGIRVEI